MKLQSIKIVQLGAIDCFSKELWQRSELLQSRYADEIAYAVSIVLNHKEIQPLPLGAAREGTKIEATVFAEQKRYEIVAVFDAEEKNFALRAYNESLIDVTGEYLYLTDHCTEQDCSEIFDGTRKDMTLQFLKYIREDLYFSRRELCERTGDMSNLKAFRAYLRTFVKDFKPEPIREGKGYEIFFEDSGKYGIRYKNDCGMPVLLSESEHTLFRYLCFLKTAEFWRGFEEIRNLHGIKKPLIIKNFLSRIDQSIDVDDLLRRTERLGRQIIILS